MLKFQVLQAAGFAIFLGESPSSYRLVAEGTLDVADDNAACNDAFRLTNSIEEPWYKETPSIARVPEARSTSVGDIVRVIDGNEIRDYRCENVGWSRVETPVTAKA